MKRAFFAFLLLSLPAVQAAKGKKIAATLESGDNEPLSELRLKAREGVAHQAPTEEQLRRRSRILMLVDYMKRKYFSSSSSTDQAKIYIIEPSSPTGSMTSSSPRSSVSGKLSSLLHGRNAKHAEKVLRAITNPPENIFHECARTGGIEAYKTLCKLVNSVTGKLVEPGIDNYNEYGKTPLHIAAELGNFYTYEQLRSMGARDDIPGRIRGVDEDGTVRFYETTPAQCLRAYYEQLLAREELLREAQIIRIEEKKLLLRLLTLEEVMSDAALQACLSNEYNAVGNFAFFKGTPLHQAVRLVSPNLVQYFIQKNIQYIDSEKGDRFQTPLMLARDLQLPKGLHELLKSTDGAKKISRCYAEEVNAFSANKKLIIKMLEEGAIRLQESSSFGNEGSTASNSDLESSASSEF